MDLLLRPPLMQRLRPGHWVSIDYAAAALLALVYGAAFRTPAYLYGARGT